MVRESKLFLKMSLREYSLIINKHNQKLISILENQKIYGGFLKILIFWVSLVLQSETQNISILRKPPKISWLSNMLISFWLRLFIKLNYI